MAKAGSQARKIAVVKGFEAVQIQWGEIAVARRIPERFPTSLFRVIPDAAEWPAVLIVATPDGVTAALGTTDREANPRSISLFGFGEPDHIRFTPHFAEVIVRPRALDFSGRLLFSGDFLVASDVMAGRGGVEIHISAFREAPDLREHPPGSLPDPFLIATTSRRTSALSILKPDDSAKRMEGVVAFRDGEALAVGLIPRRILMAMGIQAEAADGEGS